MSLRIINKYTSSNILIIHNYVSENIFVIYHKKWKHASQVNQTFFDKKLNN